MVEDKWNRNFPLWQLSWDFGVNLVSFWYTRTFFSYKTYFPLLLHSLGMFSVRAGKKE